jgi:hypothetical protein
MKLEDLILEQSSKPVIDPTRPQVQRPVKQAPARHQQPQDQHRPVKPRIALASRQEVLEAVELLAGGKFKVSSIKGGKAKRKKVQ